MASHETHVEAEAGNNPLEPSLETEQRIRIRAYHLWQADGGPEGRDVDYWERARELEGIAESPGAGQVPIEPEQYPDEAFAQDNLGEFPDRFADQGEREMTPSLRSERATRG